MHNVNFQGTLEEETGNCVSCWRFDSTLSMGDYHRAVWFSDVVTYQAVGDILSCPVVNPLVDRKLNGRIFKIRKGHIQKGFKILIASNLTNSVYYLHTCIVKFGSVWKVYLWWVLFKTSLKGILCALADVFWWKVAGCSCSVIVFLDFLCCIFVNTVPFFLVREMCG